MKWNALDSELSKFLVETHYRVAKTGNGSEHRGPRSRNEDDVSRPVVRRLCDGIGSSVAIASGWLEGRRREELPRSRNADGGFTPERNLI